MYLQQRKRPNTKWSVRVSLHTWQWCTTRYWPLWAPSYITIVCQWCKELQLGNLNAREASGPDSLSPHLLKFLANELSPQITFIFKQSYDTDDCSKELITPVHKKGAKFDPRNYRPISITSICCKVIEYIILSHINKHLTSNNILYKSQHGFRSGISCETQFILAVHEWASTLNAKGQADIVLLDVSKAFDKVSHPKLLHKLNHYGIQGQVRQRIRAKFPL